MELSELDIFSAPAIQREVDGVFWDRVYCNESGLEISQNEVIFEIKPSLEVVSLADSYMEIVVRLQKETDDGPKNPTAAEKVGIANNVMYTIWKG